MHARKFRCLGWLSCGLALVLAAGSARAEERVVLPAPAPFEQLTGDDIRHLAGGVEPRLLLQPQGLTISASARAGKITLSGRCQPQARIVITGRELKQASLATCEAGHYSAALPSGSQQASKDIYATQLLLTGDMLAARLAGPPAVQSPRKTVTGLDAAAFVEGGSFILAPGRYRGTRLALASDSQSEAAPLSIDGAGQAILEAGTVIDIRRDNVTLRGLTFEGDASITVSGRNVRISGSAFAGCGRSGKPKSHCILLESGAQDAEIDFNRFTASSSMTIKVRAGEEADVQPTGAYIHHNEFRDIRRLSGNGQEPIQIAGPGGGGSAADLHVRIEHNLFVAADGDVEAVSIKAPGVQVRWNGFFNMDAAPNLRGAEHGEIAGNLLVRTRPIRVAGENHEIVGNIILCPRGAGLAFTHGSAGYAAARHNRATNNLVVSAKPAVSFFSLLQPVTEMASDNAISGTMVMKPELNDRLCP